MSSIEVQIRAIGSHDVMSCRKFAHEFYDEEQLWEILFKEYKEKNIAASEPQQAMTKFNNWDRNSDNFDIEVLSYIEKTYENNENVTYYYLPETFIAQTTFKGNFEQIPDVVDQLKEWVKNNDYIDLGNVYKISIIAPNHGENNPDNYVTTIGLEVRKDL